MQYYLIMLLMSIKVVLHLIVMKHTRA